MYMLGKVLDFFFSSFDKRLIVTNLTRHDHSGDLSFRRGFQVNTL